MLRKSAELIDCCNVVTKSAYSTYPFPTIAGAASSCASSAAPTAQTQILDVAQTSTAAQFSPTPPQPQLPDVQPVQIFEQALQIAVSLKDEERDPVLSEIAGKMAEAQQSERALQIASGIKSDDVRAKALLKIARNLAKAGELDQGLKVLVQFRQTPEKLDSDPQNFINASDIAIDIATKLAKSGRTEQASQVLTQSVQAVFTAEWVEGTTKDEKFAYQIRLLREIALKLVEAKRNDWAMQVLEQAIGLANKLNATKKNSDENLQIRSNLAPLMAKLGQFERAVELTKTAKPSVDKVEQMTQIAVELASAGQLKQAEQLITDALKIAQTLTDGYTSNGSCYIAKSDALRIVAVGFAQIHRIQTALKTAKGIQNCSGVASPDASFVNYRGDTYFEIIQQLAKPNEITSILPTIQALKDKLDKHQSLAVIALKLAEMGEVKQAFQIAQQTQPLNPDGDRWEGDNRKALSKLVVKLAEQEAFDYAIQIEQKFSSSLFENERSILLIEIGKNLNQSGQPDQATLLFSQAFRFAQTFGADYVKESRDEVNSEKRYSIAVAFAKADQPEAAIQLIQGVQLIPPCNWQGYLSGSDSPYVYCLMGNLAFELAKAGQFKSALQMVSNIPSPQVKAEILADVAVELANYKPH